MNQHHIKTYGKSFDYHQFVDRFTAEHFDAKEWAKLFKQSGARFAGPCAIHHDGFALWKSHVNPWNSFDKGPKKDITGELLAALKHENLKTITTFHHARNGQRNQHTPSEWVSGGRDDCGYNSHYAYDPTLITSTSDPVLAKLYGNLPEKEFNEYWFAQVKEVVDQYEPDMIWFDSWLNLIPDAYRREMAAYYLNEASKWDKPVAIGYKQHDLPIEVGILDIEQGGKKELSERVWMTDITLSNHSWSYVEGQTYKEPALLLRNMIDVWSKNGIVLLNISPMANGIIPQKQRDILLQLGQWLNKYGEAVYGTVPFDVHGCGTAQVEDGKHGGQSATIQYTAEDIRYTCSKDGKSFYLFFLGRPTPGREICLSQLGPHRYPLHREVKRVTVLGSDIPVSHRATTNNLYLTIPNVQMDSMATVFKFDLK